MRVRLLLLVLAALLPLVDAVFATPQPAAPKARKVAFLVGVGKFKHSTELPNLLGVPQRDVEKLEEELKGRGFEVVKLTDEAATKKEVETRFRKTLDGDGDPAKSLGDGDLLLTVICSHGFTFEITDPTTKAKTKEPFVAGYDAVPGEHTNMISLNGLIESGKKFGATKLFLVDACREVPPDPNRGQTRGIEGTQMSLPRRTAVLFACGQGQLSHQSANADGGHGLFTFAVLKTIRAADRVSWTGLVNGVEQEFESNEFKELLPAGRTQVPVETKGEMGVTEVMAKRDIAKKDLLPGEREEPFEYVVNDTEKKTGTRRVLALDLGDGVTMDVVRITAKAFTMGSAAGEKERSHAEAEHAVTLTKDFYLGMHEVTQEQYEAITGKNQSHFKGDRFPVESVSWDEATAYCKLLGDKVKRKVVLPSEAQWEYACRAGTRTPFHFGSKLNGDHANHDGNYPYGTETKGKYHEKTVTVGTYPPNGFGLYDMHGNVCEWCQDYDGPYDTLRASKNPIQLNKQSEDRRVLRGGSWSGFAGFCRAANRYRNAPEYRDGCSGFRVCLPLD